MMKRLLGVVGAVLLAATVAAGLVRAAEQGKDADKKADEGLPLQATRTVDLPLDQGTWISLDVSPDGESIVFELLGDLFTLPIAGGDATRLTDGLPFDSQPRYSPDGKTIVFLSDRSGAENVWIAAADGSAPKKLSADEKADFASPAFTPDGQYVVVSRMNKGMSTYELWTYHVHGGSGVQVTKAKTSPDVPKDKQHNALGAAPSRDGRYLYYCVRSGGFQYNADLPMWQIARRDRTTGDEDVLTQAPGSAMRPQVSPDGRLLAYVTRLDGGTELRLRDLTTGEDRRLAYPVQRDDQESRFTRDLFPGYAFLPRGDALVLSTGGRIVRLDLASGASTEIPFRATATQHVGPLLRFPHRLDEGPVRARIVQSPSLSPDGRTLAFSALTRLYRMEVPGGEPVAFDAVVDPAFHPAWSPDGRWLAYVTWTTEAGGRIFKVRADGSSTPVALTSAPAYYTDPAWSPDGRLVVALRGSRFMRVRGAVDMPGQLPLDIVQVPADGGAATLVAPSRGLGAPHFGPEPDRIYVYGGGLYAQDEGQGVVSMRLDGSDRRTHLKIVGTGLYYAEKPIAAIDARVSPDGNWVLALVKNQLHLLAMPRMGGEPPTVDVGSASVPTKRLSDEGADYFAWADGGRTITWAVGSTVFRQSLDTVSFDPPKEEEDATKTSGKGGDGRNKDEKETAPKPPPYTTFDVKVELPRSDPKGALLLGGARIVTMKGDEVIESGDLLVVDDRIAAVGPAGEVKVPADARVVDVSGRTIVPGFVDTHAHWFEVRRGLLDLQNWSFLANLAYGITAGLDVQTATNDMFAYQDLVETGAILGPRAHSTGPGVFSDNDFQSLEEARGVLRRYRDRYRTHNIKSYVVGNRRQRQLVAQAARELEMMPTTEGGLDLKLDLTHVLDGFAGNEHALPIVPLREDVVSLFARAGTGYTPTLLVSYGGPFGENYFYTREEVHDDPKLNRFLPHELIDGKALRVKWFHDSQQVFPQIAASAAKIVRAGGRVGVGSHGQLQGLGYHWEMWALAEGGLTPHEVLRAATLHGAEIIGIAEDVGSLEEGKKADLVILDANPLEDVRHTNTVRYVVRNGELFEGDTLRQIWPVEKDPPPRWWLEESPAAP